MAKYLLLSLALLHEAAGRPIAETSFGKLIGSSSLETSLEGCDQYLGVPYAKPPVGALRFEDPVLWDEAYPAAGRQATSFGANCLQASPFGSPSGEEDCLFLNLWRPAKAKHVNMTVLVFIYGGGFISGGSSASILGIVPSALNLYDGCGFSVRQQVVVATLNYRLGPLGFAAFEEQGVPSANFGVKDQRQGLRWLHQELAAFGGDASKITLFGQSAGGMSVWHHIASPASKGLFRAAISESGFPVAWGWTKGRDFTQNFSAHMGCTDKTTLKSCMKQLSAKDIISNETATCNKFAFPTGSPPWQPVVDGIDMPRYPMALVKAQQTNSVPVLAGSNTDETNLFVWPFYEKGMNQSQFDEYFTGGLMENYPLEPLNDSETADVLAAYASSAADKRAVAAQMSTGVSFQCGTYISGQEYTTNDFWMYRFNHRSACQFWLKGLMPGVYHTAELQYVWGAQAKLACVFTQAEKDLSNRMETMWANFANCLDPTCGKGDFPKYNNASRKALVLQTPADEVETNYQADKCALWDRLIYDKYRGRSGAPSIAQEISV